MGSGGFGPGGVDYVGGRFVARVDSPAYFREAFVAAAAVAGAAPRAVAHRGKLAAVGLSTGAVLVWLLGEPVTR